MNFFKLGRGALCSAIYTIFVLLLALPGNAGADELTQVEHSDVDFMFVTTDGLQQYDSVFIEPVSVWYPEEVQADSKELDSLRRRARTELENEFRDAGFAIDAERQDDSLVLRIQLIDLRSDDVSNSTMSWLSHFTFKAQRGRVTLVADAFDANSGTAKLRLADRQKEAINGLHDTLDIALRDWGRVLATAATGTQPYLIATR